MTNKHYSQHQIESGTYQNVSNYHSPPEPSSSSTDSTLPANQQTNKSNDERVLINDQTPLIPKPNQNGRRSLFKLFKGILYGGASSIFFVICTVIVKLLTNVGPSEMAIFRFMGILAISCPLAIMHKMRNPNVRLLGPSELFATLLCRSLMGASSLLLRFYAFRFLPLADASVIIFSVPVFVSITAFLFLKEPFGLTEGLSVMLTILGICMTIQLPKIIIAPWFANQCPSSSSFSSSTINQTQISTFCTHNQTVNATESFISLSDVSIDNSTYIVKQLLSKNPDEYKFLIGVLAALASILFTNGIYITLRKLKNVHYSIVMFNFGWIALLESLLCTLMIDTFVWPDSWYTWAMLIILGICSFGGQSMLTLALQCDNAAPVSLARCTVDILLSFVLQYLIFDKVPNWWSISGGILITTCVILTSMKKLK